MCRAKNDEKGYKRCLAHHPVSQYIAGLVADLTGANHETISEEMRKLNTEGKNLPDVSGAEATAYVNRELFLTENDATLPSHKRKIRRNRLLRALGEVKNGVSGAYFHVWKNLLGRVRSRVGKTVAAIGLVGALSFGLSACTAGVPTGPQNTSSGTTQSQTATPTPTATEAVVAGNAVIGNGTKVTDANGSYEKISVDPKSDALKYVPANVTSAAKSRFSKAKILSGQKFVSDFVVEQSIDSSAYDSGDAGWAAWKKNEAPKYIVATPKSLHDSLLATQTGNKFPAIIISDQAGINPVAVRDGGPRESNVALNLTQVDGYEYTDPKTNKTNTYMSVRGTATAQYRATDAAVVKAVLAANPDKTEADLKKLKPELFDGKGVNNYPMSFDFAFALTESGNSWKISGYSNSYQNTFFD